MNGMSKWAMAGVIAFSCGSALAQARTGKTVMNLNSNLWNPTGPFTAETSLITGTFHAGGVAACDGCHVMHNASGGQIRSTVSAPWSDAVPAFLLQGSDQSSTCLVCHGDTAAATATTPYIIADTTAGDTANLNYSPGGDFGWLRIAGGTMTRHGHNVVANDFGMVADPNNTAPGGTFTAGTGVASFACSNCHDPHGRQRMELTAPGAATWQWTGPTVQVGLTAAITKPIWSSGSYGVLPKDDAAVGAYRLLAGVGYSPASNPAGASPFVNNPPVAVAPSAYNHSEAGGAEVRVAYGSGMSEWCQNCHTNIHLDGYLSGAMGGTGLKHPAGQGAVLKPGQFNTYNTYVSSGVYNAGPNYTSLVPFENAGKIAYNGAGGNVADITSLANAVAGTDTANIFVASGGSNVMCLSCHRAHASAFDGMVRWNADDTFITNSDVANYVDTQARGNVALTAAYYGRTPADMGAYQRSLCNKCHGKD
jgi:hypothetical protein